MSINALLGTRLPVIQAPMAGVQDSALAIAVHAAGGLGSLPCAMLDGAAMAAEMAKLQAHCGSQFNVNFFAHAETAPDTGALTLWHDLLAPYRAEFGLNDDPAVAAGSRQPFNAAAATCVETYRPAVVSFHFGLPEPALLRRVRNTGAKILASATTVEEARWLVERGVDAVIAQGLEAGGHRGHFLAADVSLQSGTFALLPQIVRAVDVPVIAAGGIADRAGAVAARALGAAAVQLGTAYLLCPEARTSPVHRAAINSTAASHTALTTVFSGRPARGIVNRLMRELGPMCPQAPDFPHASAAIGPLRKAAEAIGSGDFSPLWAGQQVTACREVGAGELTAAVAASFVA